MTVWVYPHGAPEKACEATVVCLGKTQRCILLRLHCMPVWAKAKTPYSPKALLMVLWRYTVGPWLEISNAGHYEIDEERPSQCVN